MYAAYLNAIGNKLFINDIGRCSASDIERSIAKNLQSVANLKFIERISIGIKSISGTPISSMSFKSLLIAKESIRAKAKGLAVLGFCDGGIKICENNEVIEFNCSYRTPVQIGDTKDFDYKVACENLRRNLQESMGIDISFVDIKLSDINDTELEKEELLDKVILPQIIMDGLGIIPVLKMRNEGLNQNKEVTLKSSEEEIEYLDDSLSPDPKIEEIIEGFEDCAFVNDYSADILKIGDRLIEKMTDEEKELCIINLKAKLSLHPIFDFGGAEISIEPKQDCFEFKWNFNLPIPIEESTDHVTTIMLLETGAHIERLLGIELKEDTHIVGMNTIELAPLNDHYLLDKIVVPQALYEAMGVEMKYKEKHPSGNSFNE